MSKFFQFFLLSLILLCCCVGSICACFILSNIVSIIIMIALSIILFIGFLYCFMFAISFKLGKTRKASIVNKEYIPSDNNENSDNSYYKYTYQVNINNKIKKGSFKVYSLDINVANNLNIGNEIEVNQFLFAVSVDVNKLLNTIRATYKEGDPNNELLKNSKKRISRVWKRDIIIGVSIFAVIYNG